MDGERRWIPGIIIHWARWAHMRMYQETKESLGFLFTQTTLHLSTSPGGSISSGRWVLMTRRPLDFGRRSVYPTVSAMRAPILESELSGKDFSHDYFCVPFHGVVGLDGEDSVRLRGDGGHLEEGRSEKDGLLAGLDIEAVHDLPQHLLWKKNAIFANYRMCLLKEIELRENLNV